MTPIEAHLKAYDLLDAAIRARTIAVAARLIKPDLEVLPREDLVMVAMALTVESALKLPSTQRDRRRLKSRLLQLRCAAMWAGS